MPRRGGGFARPAGDRPRPAANLGGNEAGRARKVREHPLPLDGAGCARAGLEHGARRSVARPSSVRARGWTQAELTRCARPSCRACPPLGHRWGDRAQPGTAELQPRPPARQVARRNATMRPRGRAPPDAGSARRASADPRRRRRTLARLPRAALMSTLGLMSLCTMPCFGSVTPARERVRYRRRQAHAPAAHMTSQPGPASITTCTYSGEEDTKRADRPEGVASARSQPRSEPVEVRPIRLRDLLMMQRTHAVISVPTR